MIEIDHNDFSKIGHSSSEFVEIRAARLERFLEHDSTKRRGHEELVDPLHERFLVNVMG
jgi:hypothetical protein